MSELQLRKRNLLKINGSVEQVVEMPRGEDELDPAHAAEGIELSHVGLERLHVLPVVGLRPGETELGLIDAILQGLGLRSDRREVGVALGQLRLQRDQRLTDLSLLALQRTQLLLQPSLLLLDLRQA